MTIGSIVREKCLEILAREPEITIDVPTRLALVITATEAEFDQVVAALPTDIRNGWRTMYNLGPDKPMLLGVEMKLKTPKEEARIGMSELPGWATWTAQQAVDHIEANVTDLVSAKGVLKAMAKAIVYLRDHTEITR